MRKLFTSVVAALCLAAPMSTLSAQNTQQLTEAQKEAIKKEVLPVVFEQIKEQAGIDILGWANPQISANSLSGVPALESSNLFRSTRAAQSISVKPDSILINAGLLAPEMNGTNVKVTFGGYDTKDITIGETSLSIDLPSTIDIALGTFSLVSVNITSEVGQIMGLPFTMDVNMTSMIFGLNNADIVNCSLALNDTNLEANVDIEDGMQTLLTSIGNLGSLVGGGLEIPENIATALNTDYLVQVGVGGILAGTSNQIPASLYAIANDLTGVRTPMGTAVVTLNPTNTFPIQRIDVTPYTNGQAGNPYYFDLNMSVSNQVYTLKVDKYESTEEDAPIAETTTITTSGTIAPTIFGGIQDLVNSVITRAVNELANEGEATWFQMVIDKNDATIATITVEPSVVGTDAIAEVSIDLQDKGTYTVTATADLAGSNVIEVEVADANTTYGTAYFTSNIAGVITANESVEESVATMKVVPTQNAIRVTNVDKGTYRIVSMTGAVVASGHINGDTYIPTASLAQGIYIVAVEANGTLQSVKVKL